MIPEKTIEQRMADLKKFGRALRNEKYRLAEYLVKEAGLTLSDKLWEIDFSANTLDTFEREKDLILGRESSGDKAIFVPYNDPILSLATSLAPAYLASTEADTILLKFPTEKLPELGNFMNESIRKNLTGIKFYNGNGRKFIEDIIHSNTKTVMLYGHHSWVEPLEPLFRLSGQTVIFEGGSKNPFVVAENADIDRAVMTAFENNILYSGQACFSSKRFYVHKSLHDTFVNLIKNYIDTALYLCGDPLDPNTRIGVNNSEKALQNIDSQLEQAKFKGAKVYGGKKEIIKVGSKKMTIMHPAVVYELTPDLDVVTNETFGPVMAVLSYENEEDLFRQVINNEYALISTIFGDLQSTKIQKMIADSHGYYFHNSSMVDFLRSLDAWHEEWKGYGKSAWTWDTLSNKSFVKKQESKYFIQEFSKPSADPHVDSTSLLQR